MFTSGYSYHAEKNKGKINDPERAQDVVHF